jgi:FtsP/CotA-like multicopper oxidase with cupredoxin domain
VTPTVGSAERWILRNNGGGWWHPVHIHLEAHQWQKINGQAPALQDQFKQDTTILGSGDEVEMFMKFRTWIGGFVFHCHNLEHEDMRMMFNMDPRLLPTEAPQQSQNLFP